MSKLDSYADLRAVLHAMEEDIGLGGTTYAEKSILAAVVQLQNKAPTGAFVQSSEIKTYPLCAQISNPSYFRALKKLLDDGTLSLPMNRKKGLYRLGA
ncbi:hypothetical protein N9Y74_00490 [Alphaproteobacteria bacterium]|nr:hypothetical protein [Alphaproteobacteria bacterium]